MASRWNCYPNYALHPVTGDLRILRQLHAPQMGVRRNVQIWLPPCYEMPDYRDALWPVVYMFDGQNLFDAQRAFGNQEWGVDESMQALAGEGFGAIVVGIDHGGERRILEYTPYGEGQGERTLDFLEQTLMPRILRDFRTLPQREATFIGGSSMGGLMSLHAVMTRPHLFGGAAVFSPALWPARRAIYRTVEHAQGTEPRARIYLDHGTDEPSARPMAELLRRRGHRDGETLCYVVEPGGRHDEAAWARRFPGAMRFLLAAFGRR